MHTTHTTEIDEPEPTKCQAPRAPRQYYAERDGDGGNRRDWDTYVVKRGEGRTCTMDVLMSDGPHNTMWERANEIAAALNNHARAQRIEAALRNAVGVIEYLTEQLGQHTKWSFDPAITDDVDEAISQARAALES